MNFVPADKWANIGEDFRARHPEAKALYLSPASLPLGVKVGPVTRDDAIAFMNRACRNWSDMPPLSEDDIGDLAMELLRFVTARVSALKPIEPEIISEAMVERAARAMCRAAITKPSAFMYSAEGVEYHVNNRWPEYADHARVAIAALNGAVK